MKKKYKFIALAIVAALILIRAFVEPYRISGDCMEPAIKDGRLYLLSRVSRYLRENRIGDIVLFNHEEKVWISRIVALETNTIQISEGKVLVNGVPLPEDGTVRNWTSWKYGVHAVDGPFQVPRNHVFVLSDNLSAHHDDSRVFGAISKESVIGLVW